MQYELRQRQNANNYNNPPSAKKVIIVWDMDLTNLCISHLMGALVNGFLVFIIVIETRKHFPRKIFIFIPIHMYVCMYVR